MLVSLNNSLLTFGLTLYMNSALLSEGPEFV